MSGAPPDPGGNSATVIYLIGVIMVFWSCCDILFG